MVARGLQVVDADAEVAETLGFAVAGVVVGLFFRGFGAVGVEEFD